MISPVPWRVSPGQSIFDAKNRRIAWCGYSRKSISMLIPFEEQRDNMDLMKTAPLLLQFAELAGGIILWAKDHGADQEAIRGLQMIRRGAIRAAKGGRP